MKFRNGFVSNSSSSSFIILLANISGEQVGKLVARFNHKITEEYFVCLDELAANDPCDRKLVEDIVDPTLIKWCNTCDL